jgi:hypothetical protein
MRNSAKAMQSYFEEIHTELPESLQYNFPKFEESTYVDCFKYKKLFLALSSIGFKKIKPFLFKELVKGNYYLGDLIILDSTDKLKFRVKLPIANSSSSLDQRRHLKRKSLIERILIFIFSSLGMKIRQNKLFLKLTYFLQFYSTKKVLLKSSNKVKVEYEKDLKFFNMLSN